MNRPSASVSAARRITLERNLRSSASRSGPSPRCRSIVDEHALDRLALDIQDPAGHGDALLQGDRPHVASLPVGDHVAARTV